MLENIPVEIVYYILKFVMVYDLKTIRLVCKRFSKILLYRDFVKRVFIKEEEDIEKTINTFKNLEAIHYTGILTSHIKINLPKNFFIDTKKMFDFKLFGVQNNLEFLKIDISINRFKRREALEINLPSIPNIKNLVIVAKKVVFKGKNFSIKNLKIFDSSIFEPDIVFRELYTYMPNLKSIRYYGNLGIKDEDRKKLFFSSSI